MNYKDAQQEISMLKSQNVRLREEVRGWKAASRREGFYGILLGAAIALVIGLLIGRNL